MLLPILLSYFRLDGEGLIKNRVRYKHKLFMERDFLEAWETKNAQPEEENIERFYQVLGKMPLLLPVKNDEQVPVLIMENGERFLPLITNEKRNIGDIGGVVDHMVTKFDIVKYLILEENSNLNGIIINPKDEAIQLGFDEIKNTLELSWICM